MDSPQLFSPQLLDHFQNPRGAGELPPPAVRVLAENPVCGDILVLTALWADGRISATGFKAKGCVASMAAGSACAEWLLGQSRTALQSLPPGAVDQAIDAALGGVAPESRHVLLLCRDAVRLLAQHP